MFTIKYLIHRNNTKERFLFTLANISSTAQHIKKREGRTRATLPYKKF